MAAAGHFDQSHGMLLEAVAAVPEGADGLRTTVATACAGLERFLGRYEQAHERLVIALRALPAPESVETVTLLIELTLIEFYRSRYDLMHHWAGQAVRAATGLGDGAVEAAARAMPALAYAVTGRTALARAHRADVAALVDGLSDEELSIRIDALTWLAAAELYLDLYAEADAHASRALALTRAMGRGDGFGLYQLLPRIWYVRGKLAEATELLDGAIEAGRLLGTPPALAGNLFNRSVIAVAVGDMEIALAAAEEGVEVSHELDEGFVTAWAAVRLASVLLELGQPVRATELILARAGGEEITLVPGGWRVYCLELLTRCHLVLDRPAAAERAAGLAEITARSLQLPLATAWADRAVAAVALSSGDTARAVARAAASADAAEDLGAPIEAGLSRTLAGRALAGSGQRDMAVAELQHAAAMLDACGALRYRDAAEQALGRLGHRPHRRTQPGKSDGSGVQSLTERELQVARLVVDRRTNHEIAAQLFLSQKTVESHMRNIFNKMGVASRVALARAIDHSDRAGSAGR